LIATALIILMFNAYADTIAPLTTTLGPSMKYLVLSCLVLPVVAWFRVAFSREARQRSPNKWFWLAIFTLGNAVMLGLVSLQYEMRSIILAMGATAAATVMVSAYTLLNQNSKFDLSQWGATLSS
jgi:FtsH-binding integral membrane protein